MGKSLYVIEFSSISAGVYILDEIVKQCTVKILYSKPVCIGKFLIILGGSVQDVEIAKEFIDTHEERKYMHSYLLTNAHDDISTYFNEKSKIKHKHQAGEAVGIFEVRNISNGLHSLDCALKGAIVSLNRLWLGTLIGGKCCFIITGSEENVLMGLDLSKQAIDKKYFVDSRILKNPDPETLKAMIR